MRRKDSLSIALREFVYRHFGIHARQRQVRRYNAANLGVDAYLKTHVCLKPFQNLETTNRGHVHVCCPDWLPTPIGDMNSDLLRQWAGPTAQKIRASVLDGSYKFCSRQHCRDIADRCLPHRDHPKVKETLAAFSGANIPAPVLVQLSHDRSCNLSCPSCRKERIVADKAEQEQLDAIFEGSALPLLRGAKIVYITGSGDPFASNHFRRVIKRLNRQDFGHLRFDLHTNGQLFDERAWRDLDLAGRVRSVEISIDAADPETYGIVRRGGTFQNLRKNLAFIAGLRRTGEVRRLKFSMVVQARNFTEMPAFVRLGEEFAADHVYFQMIRNWGTFSDAEFKAEFIGDPAHPRHKELIAILEAPEMSRPIARIGNILGYTRTPPTMQMPAANEANTGDDAESDVILAAD
ncbi:MAG: radical SAM protein [Methylovirgula sp.]|nr:radical SAM protein [Methylovirgula sp.]